MTSVIWLGFASILYGYFLVNHLSNISLHLANSPDSTKSNPTNTRPGFSKGPDPLLGPVPVGSGRVAKPLLPVLSACSCPPGSLLLLHFRCTGQARKRAGAIEKVSNFQVYKVPNEWLRSWVIYGTSSSSLVSALQIGRCSGSHSQSPRRASPESRALQLPIVLGCILRSLRSSLPLSPPRALPRFAFLFCWTLQVIFLFSLLGLLLSLKWAVWFLCLFGFFWCSWA